MDPPPRRRRSQVDEEAASTPHNPPPPPEPQGQSRFQVSPMPQPRFFPPITLKAYQAYMNFWYAQTQAQMQVGQMPFSTSPPTTFAQPSTQQGVKLSKLVDEVRLLGCETFSGTMGAIMAKNWMKRIIDTMIDMELEDSVTPQIRDVTGQRQTYTYASEALTY